MELAIKIVAVVSVQLADRDTSRAIGDDRTNSWIDERTRGTRFCFALETD